MTGIRFSLIVIATIVSLPAVAFAQTETETRENAADFRAPRRLLLLGLEVSSVYDSNIDHELDPVRSTGFVGGFEARFRTSPRRPILTLEYEGAVKSFSNSDRWDRVQHGLGATLAREFGSIKLEAIGDVDFRASTEDRELGNQYTLMPRLALEFAGDGRLRLFGAYRLRDFDALGRNDETILYWGGALRWRAGPNSVELQSRYEDSDSDDPGRRYIRWRHSVEYRAVLSVRNALAVELELRPRRFPDLLVDVDGTIEQRRDVRVIPSVRYIHRFPWGRELRLDYEYQRRTSNDPDEEYTAHRVTLGVRLPLVAFGS